MRQILWHLDRVAVSEKTILGMANNKKGRSLKITLRLVTAEKLNIAAQYPISFGTGVGVKHYQNSAQN